MGQTCCKEQNISTAERFAKLLPIATQGRYAVEKIISQFDDVDMDEKSVIFKAIVKGGGEERGEKKVALKVFWCGNNESVLQKVNLQKEGAKQQHHQKEGEKTNNANKNSGTDEEDDDEEEEEEEKEQKEKGEGKEEKSDAEEEKEEEEDFNLMVPLFLREILFTQFISFLSSSSPPPPAHSRSDHHHSLSGSQNNSGQNNNVNTRKCSNIVGVDDVFWFPDVLFAGAVGGEGGKDKDNNNNDIEKGKESTAAGGVQSLSPTLSSPTAARAAAMMKADSFSHFFLCAVLPLANFDLHEITASVEDAKKIAPEKQSMTEFVAKTMITQVLASLVILHRMGISHRDVKTSNILIFDEEPANLSSSSSSSSSAFAFANKNKKKDLLTTTAITPTEQKYDNNDAKKEGARRQEEEEEEEEESERGGGGDQQENQEEEEDEEDSPPYCVLADFGLSRIVWTPSLLENSPKHLVEEASASASFASSSNSSSVQTNSPFNSVLPGGGSSSSPISSTSAVMTTSVPVVAVHSSSSSPGSSLPGSGSSSNENLTAHQQQMSVEDQRKVARELWTKNWVNMDDISGHDFLFEKITKEKKKKKKKNKSEKIEEQQGKANEEKEEKSEDQQEQEEGEKKNDEKEKEEKKKEEEEKETTKTRTIINYNKQLRICHGDCCPLTDQVGSRFYRPPELHLADAYYEPAIDIWPIGCMLYELVVPCEYLFINRAVRNLEDERKYSPKLLECILTTLGVCPDEELVNSLSPEDKMETKFEEVFSSLRLKMKNSSSSSSSGLIPVKKSDTERTVYDWDRICDGKAVLSPECRAVLDAALQVDPAKRPSAEELLQMPFFADAEIPKSTRKALESFNVTPSQVPGLLLEMIHETTRQQKKRDQQKREGETERPKDQQEVEEEEKQMRELALNAYSLLCGCRDNKITYQVILSGKVVRRAM